MGIWVLYGYYMGIIWVWVSKYIFNPHTVQGLLPYNYN